MLSCDTVFASSQGVCCCSKHVTCGSTTDQGTTCALHCTFPSSHSNRMQLIGCDNKWDVSCSRNVSLSPIVLPARQFSHYLVVCAGNHRRASHQVCVFAAAAGVSCAKCAGCVLIFQVHMHACHPTRRAKFHVCYLLTHGLLCYILFAEVSTAVYGMRRLRRQATSDNSREAVPRRRQL